MGNQDHNHENEGHEEHELDEQDEQDEQDDSFEVTVSVSDETKNHKSSTKMPKNEMMSSDGDCIRLMVTFEMRPNAQLCTPKQKSISWRHSS